MPSAVHEVLRAAAGLFDQLANALPEAAVVFADLPAKEAHVRISQRLQPRLQPVLFEPGRLFAVRCSVVDQDFQVPVPRSRLRKCSVSHINVSFRFRSPRAATATRAHRATLHFRPRIPSHSPPHAHHTGLSARAAHTGYHQLPDSTPEPSQLPAGQSGNALQTEYSHKLPVVRPQLADSIPVADAVERHRNSKGTPMAQQTEDFGGLSSGSPQADVAPAA